jgi:hypothetical protein
MLARSVVEPLGQPPVDEHGPNSPTMTLAGFTISSLSAPAQVVCAPTAARRFPL